MRARERAKRLNVPFNLDGSEIIIPKLCPILKIPLKPGVRWPTDNSPSLDRCTPELGYVKGNVMVISARANRIKNNANREELIKLAKWAMKHMPP
jgi:hypothetical protein